MRKTILILLCFASFAFAQRDPVLKQIDVPHPYYYREMYLPQLTTGPSSVSWSNDNQSVIYSMQGSLWYQRLNEPFGQQLTAGPGYDYQPDWSSDGKWVVFSRYDKDAVELWLLEMATGKTHQLTTGRAVNVEPRWSPDGKRIAFVSTSHNKHFHLFVANIQNGKLETPQLLLQERQTKVSRYYYSPFDHEINPTWSPDSKELIFISNRDNIYGTGGFWRMQASPGSEPKQIHYEETTWKARPDWSPDGKRVVYSSYNGRQWHQLWIMTSQGGDPIQLSYGEFDATAPRWSHDGKKIAFISNKNGNTSLWILEIPGGAQKELVSPKRKYVGQIAHLSITVLDEKGKQTSARISVTDANGRAYAPDDAWMNADDSFDRSERPFEAHYFHSTGQSELTVPAGKTTVDVMKGFEYEFQSLPVDLKPIESRNIQIRLKPMAMPAGWNDWISADLHVHMNYAGAYRNHPEHLRFQAAAENLRIIYNLIVNKEQRIPDISYFTGKTDPVSNSAFTLMHSQEFHTSYWGHLGLLNLKQNYLLPDYSAYPNTGVASPYPTNAVVADLAHAQGALMGYVHPYDSVPDPADKSARLTHELPIDVALGKVDYLEVLGFSDHKSTAAVWYRLLNCGFRIPTGAGTDAMANYSSLRGPVGMNRVYANSGGSLDLTQWNEALRKGRTFATNGPLLMFTINGKGPGDVLTFHGAQQLKYEANLRSIVPMDHLEIIWNGNVIQTLSLQKDRKSFDFSGSIPVKESGWLVLRAWNEKSAYPILDIYPYATTSPIYVEIDGKPVRSSEASAYFIAWIDRAIEHTKAHTDYNTDAEKEETLKMLQQARAVYMDRK